MGEERGKGREKKRRRKSPKDSIFFFSFFFFSFCCGYSFSLLLAATLFYERLRRQKRERMRQNDARESDGATEGENNGVWEGEKKKRNFYRGRE